ncbi:MAG: endo-arabinase [Bacteroidota bacterium]|nr:endo-arabinase [Bacteroidota bacterium]
MKYAIAICLLFSYVCGYSQKTNDTLAIKTLLEKESATWRSGDAKGHADCWKVEPYSIIIVSTADGKAFEVPASAMIQASPAMGKGGTSVNSNYKMSIHGDNAWVTHNEESTGKDDIKSYSYEMKILEKIDGEWKLVAQSIHLYKP